VYIHDIGAKVMGSMGSWSVTREGWPGGGFVGVAGDGIVTRDLSGAYLVIRLWFDIWSSFYMGRRLKVCAVIGTDDLRLVLGFRRNVLSIGHDDEGHVHSLRL